MNYESSNCPFGGFQLVNSFWLETPNDEPKKNNIIGKTIEL